VIGALVGLAVGDALGTTLEFRQPDSFEPIDDMVGGGPFRLHAGMWTDDTSMALCLAESLVERGEFDPVDQMERYLRWYRDGHHSPTGRCFDIGRTTREALERFERMGDPFAGPTGPMTAGNGSLMRLAPIPMAYRDDPARAVALAGEMSRTTHGATEAVDACRYYAGLIVGAMQGVPKETLLAPRFEPAPGIWEAQPLVDTIDEVAAGSFLHRNPPEIVGAGHVTRSLEAALWAFARTDDFRSGALAVVNLGLDADTTGAIYGQLAGAYYGVDAIPSVWRTRVSLWGDVEGMAKRLVQA